MWRPSEAEPQFVVTIPRSLIQVPAQRLAESVSRFEHALGQALTQRLDCWTRVTVRGDGECRITTPLRPIELDVIATIDAELDRMLALPDSWDRRPAWWWSCDWVDTDRYAGAAHWEGFRLKYDAVTHSEPFLLYVGLRAAGDQLRIWYRCRLPMERPIETTGFRVVDTALGRWLAERWPEGPDGNA